MKRWDVILLAAGLLLCGGLALCMWYARRSPNAKWRLCWLLTGAVCLFCMAAGGVDGRLLPAYLGAAAVTLGFFTDSAAFRRTVLGSSAALTVLAGVLCLTLPDSRRVTFTDDFDKGFAAFRQQYSLAGYKDLDMDALYKTYRPLFEQADKDGDQKAATAAWMQFTAACRDGHLGYMSMNDMDDDDKNDEYMEILRGAFGKDHGLVIAGLTDGTAVAVEVDPSLEALGIHDGTVVTAWNGRSPAEAARNSEAAKYKTFPTAEVSDLMQISFAAGTGENDAELRFLDDDGQEQTAQLPVMGDYLERVMIYYARISMGLTDENFAWEQLDETTAYLHISGLVSDLVDSESQSFEALKRQLRSDWAAMQAAGARDLVLDLRDNTGGMVMMGPAIAELLAPAGSQIYCYSGVWDDADRCYVREPDGRYAVGERHTYRGEDMLEGGRIVVLVSAQTFSAGEQLAAALSRLPQVTVMGHTGTTGSAQTYSAAVLKYGCLLIPTGLNLNEDGTPLIDADGSGRGGVEPDVRVPFDAETIRAMYEEGTDVLIEQALEYLHTAG